MRFIHIADIHLGYQQYNLPARFDDFGLAFERAIQYGIEHYADAILVAGDLFNKATLEPLAFIQAADILEQARQAGIPVIAVEGNHDQARWRDQVSWMQVLAHEGYLTLLAHDPKEEGLSFTPWDGRRGGYLDIENIRVVGLPWLGAAAAPLMVDIAGAIRALPKPDGRITVLLTHAGVEGEMPQMPGCLTYAQLEPLRHCVDYLALGHLHKQFGRDGWAFNPGSLEVCGMNERGWAKGLYDVTVDGNGSITAKHVKLPCRPFYSEAFPVDTYTSPSELLRTLGDALQGWRRNWRIDGLEPVIEIRLTGVLQFEPSDLDREAIKALIKDKIGSLHEEVDTARLKLRGLDLAEAEIESPEDLERSVLRALAESDSRYAPRAEAWAGVMLEVKKLALADTNPEAILTMLQTRIDEFDAEVADGDH